MSSNSLVNYVNVLSWQVTCIPVDDCSLKEGVLTVTGSCTWMDKVVRVVVSIVWLRSMMVLIGQISC